MKKIIFLIFVVFNFYSCQKSSHDNEELITQNSYHQDTIVKIDKTLNSGSFSKSINYFWLKSNDTLDLSISIKEYKKDSSIILSVSHKQPILFKDLLKQINNILPIVKQDFNIYNLKGIYLKQPIYYKDLAVNLTKEYQNRFGFKNVSYNQLRSLLLESDLSKKIDSSFNQYDKKVNSVIIEKFHLLKKENYKYYLSNEDFNEYPDFTIHGIKTEIYLNNL